MMLLNKIPLSIRILIAMLFGFAVGAYSSNVYTGVSALADAFVMLLQMTALPYISLSLVVGIGSLSPLEARSTFRQSLVVLLALTLTVVGFILLAPIAFPDWENAEFYSANTIKASVEFDLVSLFIPANPFNAFANAIIPSVVLFSVFLGVGLMGVAYKARTLLLLDNFKSAVANVNNIVMRFAPLGVFCIALRAAATIESSQVDGLVVYVVTVAVLVLLLSFMVLPGIVAVVTPFGYRQILKASREAMITAFATGSFFVVIPVIVEKTKALIAEINPPGQNADKVSGIVVPISFSLPVGGKLLALVFTLFAAWFSGAYISLNDYANLLLAGIPQLFATPTIAMPNLLELFNVSGGMFDFFIVSENLIVARLAAVLSVVFATCLPLMIATSMVKKTTFKWRKFSRYLVIIPLLSVATFVLLRFTFDAISHQYEGYTKFIERDFIYGDVKTTYLDQASEQGPTRPVSANVLTRIKQRGFIRVGYFRDDLPYSFHNDKGKLVGFDIEIMNQLAADLGVAVEFVKIFRKQAAPLLKSGYLDITTGFPVIPDNMKTYTLTTPYSTQSIALIVKDTRRAEFINWADITKREDLIIGIPEAFYYRDAIKRHFTRGKAWEIATPRLFFRDEYKHIDAMLFGAPSASAWTLLNPSYTVVVPKPVQPPLSMAFPISPSDRGFELFMRNWINMKAQNKTLERLFNYWIGGKHELLFWMPAADDKRS
ncbi:cation:dicarboxylate symporter family transporter [Alkalimarinus alittae]|uniref:Cation:dicarboxylase symporter family transporter n=1 Tax=Alkalimarinus alittae TaxID=2961619 RepID=A0ABY6N318_9ALTE|nr:cation:dicarboxylase symporter family transporter [Alkalimarinus alittae]UZE96507.1 cation:dicarboxylase symporter family transporter [Alkalimarinus alittae]